VKLWLVLLVAGFAPILLSQKTGRTDQKDKWVLAFGDEFDGTELDLHRWSPHEPFGHSRDRQMQAYAPEQLQVSGGQLHIIARHVDGISASYDGQDRQYVSGLISTFGMFAQTYGKFEIRCRLPAGRGLRPAFVLMPLPSGALPSIDVFQTTGDPAPKIFFGNHWGTEQTERSYGNGLDAGDLSSSFHTISMEWDREHITWFVDAREKFHSWDGVPHQPMYLMIDLAVGGRLAGAPDASTVLPASFDIDYVHVYRRP